MAYREELEKQFKDYLTEFTRQYGELLRKVLSSLEKQVGEIPEEVTTEAGGADEVKPKDALIRLEGALLYLQGRIEDEVNLLLDLLKAYFSKILEGGTEQEQMRAKALLDQYINEIKKTIDKIKEEVA